MIRFLPSLRKRTGSVNLHDNRLDQQATRSHLRVATTLSVAGPVDTESALTDFDPSRPYSWPFASF
jgi:hypothetical protein